MTEELPQRDPEEYGFGQDRTTVYDEIGEKRNGFQQDSDGDGIFDYKEKV